MNMRSLEYVVAVNETGSVQGAAKVCFATPGTISMQITRMEEYLGVKLFECRRYPAQLTTTGESMLPKIQALVESYREVVRQARSASLNAQGPAQTSRSMLTATPY